MLLPTRLSLAAADEAEPSGFAQNELIQFLDTESPLLVELLLAATGDQLFVSMRDAGFANHIVRVNVALDSGQARTEVLQLTNGEAIWNLPSDLVLTGVCSVSFEVLEPANE